MEHEVSIWNSAYGLDLSSDLGPVISHRLVTLWGLGVTLLEAAARGGPGRHSSLLRWGPRRLRWVPPWSTFPGSREQAGNT